MNTGFKKFISVFLVILMCVTAVPINGFVPFDVGVKASAADECEHTDGTDLFNNVCDKCYAYLLDYDIKEGANQTVNATTSALKNPVLRFIPEVTGTYIISSSNSSTDPMVNIYDSNLQLLEEADDENGHDFVLECDLTSGEIYYLAFLDYESGYETTTYDVSIYPKNHTCTSTGTQNCKGYACDLCGNYFGDKSTHTDGEDEYNNLCDACYEYLLDENIKFGEKITISATHNSDNVYKLYRFVPSETAYYLIKSYDTVGDPKVYLYNTSLNCDDYDDDSGDDYNFKLKVELEKDKTYYFAFINYTESVTEYEVKIEKSHNCTSSSDATCLGFKCDTCGEYFGEPDESKHDISSSTQTCKGYQCSLCLEYVGEKDETRHNLSTTQTCKGYKCNVCGNYFGDKSTHTDGEDEYNNLCDVCYEYLLDEDIKFGEKITISATYNSDNVYKLYRFVPSETAYYLIESYDTVGDPNVYLYNTSLNCDDYDDDSGDDYNFKLKVELEKDKTYYFAFTNHTESVTGYEVKIEKSHNCTSSSDATCLGFKCDTCGEYFGEPDETKHDISSSTQTCKGYLCSLCEEYVGEKDETKHVPDSSYGQTCKGYYCEFCYEFYGEKAAHTDGSDWKDGYCDECFEFIGKEIEPGIDITVPVSKTAYVKFKFETSGTYVITGNTDSSPKVEIVAVDHSPIVSYSCDPEDNGYFMFMQDFNSEKTYYFRFMDNEDATQYNISIYPEEHTCDKTGSQTCCGYRCSICGNYSGEIDKTKHNLSQTQTCAGYKCQDCGKYFGEKDATKHLWNSKGICLLCKTEHEHSAIDANGNCTGCSCKMYFKLTSNGTVKYYPDLDKAISGAKNGDEIVMLADYYITENVTVNKAITFDLNGNTLSPFLYSNEYVKVTAAAMFKDSKAKGYFYPPILISEDGFKLLSGEYQFMKIDYETENHLDAYLAPCSIYYIILDDGNDHILDFSQKVNTEGHFYVKSQHSFSNTTDKKAATCLEDGYKTAYKQCTVCKKYFDVDAKTDAEGLSSVDSFVEKATGHSFADAVHKDVTCTENGYDYKQCKLCQKYFATDANTNSKDGKATAESFTVVSNGHDFTGDIKSDGNGKDATHSFKCKNGCGTYGNAVNHTWDNGTQTKAATHTELGVMTYKCTCGATYTENIAKLKEHTYITNVVVPTCTEEGYTEHKCACGDTYKDNYIKADGHKYVNGSCTYCGEADPNYNPTSGDKTDTENCDCICHKTNGFVKFIYKIVNFFWKLFKIHPTCDCGVAHY